MIFFRGIFCISFSFLALSGQHENVNDYSGRVWTGLIRDYYVTRWKNYNKDTSKKKKENMRIWEEKWVTTPGVTTIVPYDNPLLIAQKMYDKFK